MPKAERMTTVLLRGGHDETISTTVRVRYGSLKIKDGVCTAVGIHGTELLFPLSELLRVESPVPD